MAEKKSASSENQPTATKQKSRSSKKKRKDARQKRKVVTQEPKVIKQEPNTSKKRPSNWQKRKGRGALSEKEEHEIQHEFLSQQQAFRDAIEDSAKLLRQAAESALEQIRAQSHQAVSDPFGPNAPRSPEGPLNSLTDQFVETAYKRAKEMFDEIGPGGVQSGNVSPQIPLPPFERPFAKPGEDALATSALLMNQATQYLNQAINSVMKEMDRRLRHADRTSPQAPPPRPKR
jgi:hypothetical protein